MRARSILLFTVLGAALPAVSRATIETYTYVGEASSQVTPSNPFSPSYNPDAPFYGYVDNVGFTAVYTVDFSRGTYYNQPGPYPYSYSYFSNGFGYTTNPIGLTLTIGAVIEDFSMFLPTAIGGLADSYRYGTLVGQYLSYSATVLDGASNVYVLADTGGDPAQPLGGGIILIGGAGESVINFSNATLRVDDLSGVPEPPSWMVITLGIGGLGGVLRLNRKQAAI